MATVSAAVIRPVLDVSTGHLPARYAENGPGAEEGVIAYALGEYGWLMWVPDDPDTHSADYDLAAQAPEILVVQRYARAAGCDYVMFDRDSEANPDLPTWEW